MKIAIIGAGLCGLATCWYLLEKGQVTLFDPKGIGGGTSGIACGLLHPYVGEKARRSQHADEAMEATKELLSIAKEALGKDVADYSGIRRVISDPKLADEIRLRTKEYDDIEWQNSNEFLITSGITVYSKLYLNGLWKACEEKDAKLIPMRVPRLNDLSPFDLIVVANGSGAVTFYPELLEHFELIKGQVLTCKVKGEPLSQSIIGKGYIAKTEREGIVDVGSTYERDYLNEEVDEQIAKRDVYNKVRSFYPEALHWPIIGYKAGVRLSRKGHYLPLLEQKDEKTWLLTGMGSRGLLYHAYFASKLASIN